MFDVELQNPTFRPIPEGGSRLDEQSNRPHVTIYSDGSYKPAIDYGGYGTLMSCAGHGMLICGGSQTDSNNRMELTAVLTALRRLNTPCEVTIVSDSRYVIDALNGYIWNWCSNGWKTTKNQPVANLDLWQEMLRLCQIHRIHGQWIKGHMGHPMNERCDRLATLGAYGAASLPVPPSHDYLRNLSKNKLPGYEDEELDLPEYEIPM